jgi:hypothetical protein
MQVVHKIAGSVKETFDKIDDDKSGFIDSNELEKLLKEVLGRDPKKEVSCVTSSYTSVTSSNTYVTSWRSSSKRSLGVIPRKRYTVYAVYTGYTVYNGILVYTQMMYIMYTIMYIMYIIMYIMYISI